MCGTWLTFVYVWIVFTYVFSKSALSKWGLPVEYGKGKNYIHYILESKTILLILRN